LAERSIDRLRRTVVAMSELVEQNVDTAIMALIDRSDDLANQVLTFKRDIDEADLEIGRVSSEILRKNKLSDSEFRFTVAAMRISVHLERISELSSDIAREALYLNKKRSTLSGVDDLAEMLEDSAGMVRDSVGSLINGNADMAWDVCVRDDAVDECFRRIIAEIAESARSQPGSSDLAVRLSFAASGLESIADQAVNIAQEVIFALEGKIVAHHLAEHRRTREAERKKRPSRGEGRAKDGRPREDA